MKKAESKKKQKLQSSQLDKVVGGIIARYSSPSFASLGVSYQTTAPDTLWSPNYNITYYFWRGKGMTSIDKRGDNAKVVQYAFKDVMPSKTYAENWMGGAANFKNFYTGTVGAWPGWGTGAWKS